MDADRREYLGKVVRAAWVAWASRQPFCKPSWLLTWEELPEPDKEVDRLIGETIWQLAGTYEGALMWSRESDPYRAEKQAWEDVTVNDPAHWIPGDWLGRNER